MRPPAGLVWVLAIGLFAAVAFVVAYYSSAPGPENPSSAAGAFPLTPVSASPYLNTGPDARYVGSDACRECHQDRHASFRRTGMGRSMAVVDPAREPADASYAHPPSRRRYQIERTDGRLWHREWLRTPGTPEVLLSEFPMQYVVGSGRHSLTYLCEADGFLVESPATWYTAKRAWEMSPGYTTPDQPGFERAAGEGCLICHAGRVEAVEGSLHRMRVVEAAIGCERCHGPGSLHAERHRDKAPPPGPDFTIVNPARLPRDLAESICQQCHLRPTAVVVARGRKPTDFRPGLPLDDFLHAFQDDVTDTPMTVVGHVEQMHLSRCYQSSATLTCITCHDPHGEPEPAERIGYYKAACLKCHQSEHCKLAADQRLRESPDNDCIRCHMPTSPTEIPHLAFTHHRIGVHRKPTNVPGSETGPGSLDLRAFTDLSRFAEIDRQRSRGLAHLEAANRASDQARSHGHRRQAMELLSAARTAGMSDPVVDTALARLRFDLGLGQVLTHAEEALRHPGLAGQDRCTALFLRADALAAAGNDAEALVSLRELNRLQRHSTYWLLTADCERRLGHEEAWAEALTTATRITPRLWKVHQALADYHAAKGAADRAAWHRARAVP